MIVAGQTAHYVVSYDDSLSNGAALANAILGQCEQDLSALSSLYGGIMPAAASLPFQVSLVPGGGGASHPGCLATAITCYIYAGSLVQGIPLLVDAEVVEVFEATRGRGVNCGYSNGEAFSRVLPTVLYPNLRYLFSTGNSWLNSTNPSRPDWVTNTEPTDQDLVSIGCAVQIPEWIGRGLRPERTDLDADNIVDASVAEGGHRMVRLGLDPYGRHVLGQVDLPAGTTAISYLRVHIPAESHERAVDITIRQLYADREVGRITWRLVPEH